eukprot:5459843-Pleurochrysis_carterae.AAC.1
MALPGGAVGEGTMATTIEGEGGLDPNEAQAQLQRMRDNCQELARKINELDMDKNEHRLVMEALKPLNAGRKCFRMVGSVMVERTVAEVMPAVQKNMEQVLSLSETDSALVSLHARTHTLTSAGTCRHEHLCAHISTCKYVGEQANAREEGGGHREVGSMREPQSEIGIERLINRLGGGGLGACMRACLHACVPVCVRTCMLACVHAFVRACLCACARARVRACARACMRACMCACVRARSSMRVRVQACLRAPSSMRASAFKHACVRTRMCAGVCAHAYVRMRMCAC